MIGEIFTLHCKPSKFYQPYTYVKKNTPRKGMFEPTQEETNFVNVAEVDCDGNKITETFWDDDMNRENCRYFYIFHVPINDLTKVE